LERVEDTAQLFWEVEPLEEAGDGAVARRSETHHKPFKAVLRIRIRRINMFLGHPDCSISSKNSKKNIDSYYFARVLYDFLSLKNDVNVSSKRKRQKNIRR
jgi:hypothetical protein